MCLRRPILKMSLAETQPREPSSRGGHVHFPPTPEISSTYFAHSAKSYDRSAIVVSPNVCSLPKRHCPNRTYVLSDGKDEGHLLNSIETIGMRDDLEEEEAEDDTPNADRDQGAAWIDYFSIPSPSKVPQMAWSESDDSDELFSPPNEIDSNRDHSPKPVLDIHVHDGHAHEASKPHEPRVQATLIFLPPASLSAERNRNPSLQDLARQDRAHSLPDAESTGTRLARSRRSRRASFTNDVLPDSDCLSGF